MNQYVIEWYSPFYDEWIVATTETDDLSELESKLRRIKVGNPLARGRIVLLGQDGRREVVTQ